jgi:SAM-dependent methyltransferase
MHQSTSAFFCCISSRNGSYAAWQKNLLWPRWGGSFSDFVLTFFENPVLPLSNLEAFKEKAFAKLWLKFGPVCAEDIPASLPPLLADCRGVMLDVGPGSGEQLKRFSRPENIKAIYGVEPGVSLHEKLKAKAKEAGLGDKYHVLSATADLDAMIPELIKAGLIKEGKTSSTDLQLFDQIVCLRVLCGVPDQASSIADLYSLLKPGGKFIVCEHVLNTTHLPARLAQKFYMLLGWRQLMGGCCLTRNTMETFLRVATARDGGWAKIDVQKHDEMGPVIHVVGVLTKKS